jgi:hypothetical protein
LTRSRFSGIQKVNVNNSGEATTMLGFRSHSTSQMGCTLAMTKTPNRATTTDIARFWKKTDLVLSPDGTRNAATP